MNEKLKYWLEHIPMLYYHEILGEIRKECDVTTQTIRNWKIGKTKPLKIQQEKINEIAGRYELDKPFNM